MLFEKLERQDMWWVLFAALVGYFAYRGLAERPLHSKRAAAPSNSVKEPLRPVRPYVGVGSGPVSFDVERNGSEKIKQFEALAKDFLQSKFSEPLPEEVSSFVDDFAARGLAAFPKDTRTGRSIQIKTASGLLLRLEASAGMYWTELDVGHLSLTIDD
ncbi:MAG TPA: hypothetical protein P5036_07065 [Albidovulum sp.]|uniref:hypothetical protein n=1 Tax=Albidovulum sp. TaxID=1872424 RepID=UPI002C702A0E|nr:hypothetical protein [Defluviimonas sp.]MCO5127992.1 hypothetical protein [Paracoccaceae bacterium]MCP5377037.1 hypothetical protein [Paracoccaceae bacterium]HRV62727.1 hypothetical protein [Albidovulum sp.]